MRLIIVRHGQTAHNRDRIVQGWYNAELTDEGLKQAEDLAASLPDKPDIIFSSDLGRCRQTVEPIARKFPDAPLLFDWRLRERNFGELQNKSAKIDWDSIFNVGPYDSPHGVEPLAHWEERLKSFVRDLNIYHINTAVVVTHGGVLNRIGYILDPNYEHQAYGNTATIELDIDPADTRFLPSQKLKPWKPLS